VAAEYGANSSFCGCSATITAGGPNCDQILPSFQVVEAVDGLIISLCVIFFLVSARDLFRLMLLNSVSLRTGLTQTLALMFVFYMVSFIGTATDMYCAQETQKFIYTAGSPYKVCTLDLLVFVIGVIVLFCGFMAFTNVAVLWIEVALTTNKLQKLQNSSWMKTSVRAFQVLYLACLLGALLSGQTNVALSMQLPFGVIVIFLYAYGGYKLGTVLKESKAQTGGISAALDKALFRVRVTALGICISLSITVLLLLISLIIAIPSLTFTYENVGPEGLHRPAYWTYSAGRVFSTFTVCIVATYVHLSAVSKIEKLSSDRSRSATGAGKKDGTGLGAMKSVKTNAVVDDGQQNQSGHVSYKANHASLVVASDATGGGGE
jgi:hypothetical protein